MNKEEKENIIYFELNNWASGENYPAEEPFTTWIENDSNIFFDNIDWVKKNGLCVYRSIIDMSINFCITATKSWIENNCPKLLTEYKKFLRYPNEDGYVYGKFYDKFLKYSEKNIGIFEKVMENN